MKHLWNSNSYVPRVLALAVAVALGLPGLAHAQSAEKVMKDLAKLDIDFVGIASGLPDGQYLGERDLDERSQDQRSAGDRASQTGRVVYTWDSHASPADKVSAEHKLAIEHLTRAGIPMVRGGSVELERGMFQNNRYRMGGVLNRIDIRGKSRYEVRVTIDWTLYDGKEQKVLFTGLSTGMSKGAVLGDRGEQPNSLMDSVIDALDNVLDKKVPEALKDG